MWAKVLTNLTNLNYKLEFLLQILYVNFFFIYIYPGRHLYHRVIKLRKFPLLSSLKRYS